MFTQIALGEQHRHEGSCSPATPHDRHFNAGNLTHPVHFPTAGGLSVTKLLGQVTARQPLRGSGLAYGWAGALAGLGLVPG